jgi:two-component system response regulator RegA
MTHPSPHHAADSVLLVDDDVVFLNTFAREFARRRWRVSTATTCAAAARAVRRHRPRLIVLDLLLADESGLDLIEQLRADAPATRIVMTTGHPSLDTAVEAMRRGAQNYVQKPCRVEDLIAAGDVPPATPPPAADPSTAVSLAQKERAYINSVIEACGGNISEAARRLGVHRRSLQRKLRKHIPGM